MKPGAYLACVAALLAGTTWTVRAETYVGGVICTDTTWDLAGSPYIVTREAGSSVVVCCGVTLTIEPGVEVRFEPGLALRVAGTLVARGTEQSPIVFTSNQPTPAPGDWSRIEFLDQAADATFDGSGNYESGCILEHVIVKYAGADDYAAVNVNRAAPFLSHCEIRDNLKWGIYVYSAPPLRIENCFVHDNQDSGIYFYNSGGNTLMWNVVRANRATGSGGGIQFGFTTGGNTLVGNTVSENSSVGYGGGIFFSSGSHGNTLIGNTVSANVAGPGMYGAGVCFEESGRNALIGNTISNNLGAFSGGGLCFRLSGSSTNTVVGNTFTGNTVTGYGGGIFLWDSVDNVIACNAFVGNGAQTGGGGIAFSYDGKSVLTNNTFRANTADVYGGGGILCGGTNRVTLANCTFSGNLSNTPRGGAVSMGGFSNVTVVDCILWGDTPPEVHVQDMSNLIVRYCDIQGNWPGSGNIDLDPLFVDPVNGNLRLSAGSPCIDAGDNTAVPRDTADLDHDGCTTDRTPLDLDGHYRFHDDPNTADTGVGTYWHPGVVDMGAYEYGSDPNVPAGPCFADLNCDGGVNFGDINPFVLALSDPMAYEEAYPDCDIMNADINEDCQVNFADINSFVALLSGP